VDIRSLTPTICHLMGVAPPHQSTSQRQDNLIVKLKQDGIERIDKCLIYAPDAIGKAIHEKYPGHFHSLETFINHTEPLRSIFPSVTPVCFASMFTGALPEVHGIQAYERPVVKIETIFDAMLVGGKKTAIIAVTNCSIDLIFKERKLDYYSKKDDAEVIKTTLDVFDKYDFAVVYNQEYDSTLHKTHPYSPECLRALEHHNRTFEELFRAVETKWAGYNWLLAYTPDHGAHYNEIDKMGTHGKDIPEDMELLHHYAYGRKR
jgi:predicted AlkP superfamily pyrophosphatase or phosphodiesterase